MNCEQARGLTALAASGDVTAAETLALESHTAACAECRAEADTFAVLCSRLAAMRDEHAPDSVLATVRARVVADIYERRRPRWIWAWPAFAAIAMSGLILVIASRPDISPVVPAPALVRTEVAGVQPKAAPVFSPEPAHRRRKTLRREVAAVSADPLVVHMFTDDPEVVIYWIADAERNRAGKEIVQ